MYPLTINHWKVEGKLGVGPVFDKPLVLPEDMDILVELYVKVALIKHVYDAITLTRQAQVLREGSSDWIHRSTLDIVGLHGRGRRIF